MRIGGLAQAVGVGPDWVRRLEGEGRIPPAPRDRNGHRRYSLEDVKKVRDLLFRARPGTRQ